MSRRLTVLVESSPDAFAAAAWAVGIAHGDDVVELVAPWRAGQNEWNAATASVVDARTAARLRLLTVLDRVRAVRPDARLVLTPVAGSPQSVLPTVSATSDLLVLAGRAPGRWRRGGELGRSPALIRKSASPVVIVRAGYDAALVALLVEPSGSRMEATPDALRRLARP